MVSSPATPIPSGAPKSILTDVVDSIFTPGTNTGLIKAMSYSFYALFLTLLGMLYLTSGNLHVWALLGLSVGLFASIKWFLAQIAEVEEVHKAERLKKEKEERIMQKKGGALGTKGKAE